MHNIAIITGTLQGGGAERCAADLSFIFTKNGFQVFIFTDLSVNVEYEYAGSLVDFCFGLPVVNEEQESTPFRNKIDELKKLKSRYGIDIAVSFMQWANYLNILSKEKEKVVLTTHSVNSEYAKYERAVFWSEETFRILYQYADLITFPSEFCRKDWLEHYGDKNRITRTIYNPVHMMRGRAIANKRNIVITVGRMHSIKRQWHLIKAFALVKKTCPDSRLIILGDGELRAKLEAVIAHYHLENDVEMPGNVRNVQDYLEKAKVFAMTSRCEAMPCSVLEALSAGVPVVSCDSPGGIREELGISYHQECVHSALTGECGIITPYINECAMDDISHEEELLAGEIVHLLQDDAARTKMAAAAVRMAQRFSADAIGTVWVHEISKNDRKREIPQSEFEEIREKNISSFPNPQAVNAQMYISYYRLLEKWMILHERGGCAKQYFMEHGINNVIIYGLGKMANHLIEDIKESGINIICAIDMRAFNLYDGFPVITPDETIPDADCIIITPVHEVKSIQQKLENRTSIPLISLSEVIDGCINQRN